MPYVYGGRLKMNTVQQYKCNNCGASLSFSAESQSFECEFCKSTFTQEELDKILSERENPNQEDEGFSENVAVYHCDSCGAEIISDDTTAATFCHYCHSPVILKNRVSGMQKPSFIIPFAIDKKEALDWYYEWLKEKICIPSKFKHIKPEQITGLYVPFWLYTSTIDSKMKFECYDSTSYRSGDYIIEKRKYYTAYRDGVFDFNKVPSSASTKADSMLLSAIEPFKYKDLKPFSMSYLSGYLADKYDVSKEECFKFSYYRMLESARATAIQSIEHQNISITHEDAKVEKTQSDYVLLPVWYAMVEYCDEHYTFAINAQTGKVAGKLPLSVPKIALICLILSLLIFAVGTFFVSLM